MEEVIDAEVLICDPHIHIWSNPGDRFMAEELRAEVSAGHRVTQTVFVECATGYRTDGPEALRPVGETELVVAADPERLIGAIVAFADLRAEELGDVLAAHADAADGRLRGIRNGAAWDASRELQRDTIPQGLLADARLRDGVAALGRAGLIFETWLFHPQIPELDALARAQPDVPIVLNHLGGPLAVGPYAGRREEVREAWRTAMRELSARPNVLVKLGGVGMSMFFGTDWHADAAAASSEEIAAAWGPDIRWCIEQFGADRCMFESNFPVDRVSCSYVALWNAFKRITADASPAERAALFHDTATRLYGI